MSKGKGDKVVKLENYRNPGSKARRAMMMAIMGVFCEECIPDSEVGRVADGLLGHLWIEGYVVTPRGKDPDADKPPLLA
jgi:hypothetical protein